MKIKLFAIITLSLLTTHTTYANEHLPLQTVNYVDLSRYAGEWNQVAYLPTKFQRNCTIDTTAFYTVQDDGTVGVRNECTKANGTRKSITGYAWIKDTQTNAKLKVKFFWFAPAGDYWVIDLATDYSYAVVGTPDRKFLWILSRSKTMKRELYDSILEKVKEQAFPAEKVEITGSVE